MNDEQRPVTVRILDSRYDPATATGDKYVVLQAAEGQLFDLQLHEGHVPYIKKWPNMVMISGVDPSVFGQTSVS